MNQDDTVIRVRNLRKNFDAYEAVRGISFEVRRGEIFGLLGPNGAGKTTTIHMLLGLVTPTSGEISVLGFDPRRDLRTMLARVNFSSAYIVLPGNLTVTENLRVFAMLYGVPRREERIRELLEMFGIPEVADKITGALSSGQQTRVNLCKAFLNDPEILFLDEPTASLDPHIAARVRAVLFSIQAERGVTMIYTSHNMSEVEAMCDRVAFLSRGSIVTTGTPEEIRAAAHGRSLEDVFIDIAEGGEIRDLAADDDQGGC